MAVAAPARRSSSQTAPAPSRTAPPARGGGGSRTAPPGPKKRPRDRPRPGGRGRSAASATGEKATTARATAAPARKPTRKAPARRKAAPKSRSRAAAGVIPIAAGHAGRAAVAVTQLPESGLIHRLTRGRAWIGLLGVLLVGIVALNVVTLTFTAAAGKVDVKNTELSKENSMLQSLVAKKYGQARIRHEAAEAGLAMSTTAIPQLITARKGDVAEAASRLAAAEAAAGGATSAEEHASGEEASSGEEAAGDEAGAGGEAATTGAGESEFTPEEEAIYNREYEELLAAEGAEAGVYEESVAAEGVTEVPAG